MFVAYPLIVKATIKEKYKLLQEYYWQSILGVVVD